MGGSTREKGVLKLVHPGRHVEIHRKPTTAAEVMKKNPRHCIARPDVFKYPWIVVRPESVLVPGKVFYIVPNRTIYDLLKAKGCNQPPEQLKHSQEGHDHQDLSKQLASLKFCAGMTPKHQHHVQDLKKLSIKYVPSEAIPREQDSDKSLIKPSQVFSWPEVKIVNRKMSHQEFHHKYSAKSPVNTRCFHARRSALLETENGDLQITSCEQINKLRSCLRKQGSVRKSLNLKVTFVL